MSQEELYDSCKADFLMDYRIYLDIVEEVEGQPLSAFIISLVDASPFKIRFVAEFAQMLILPGMLSCLTSHHSTEFPNGTQQRIVNLIGYMFQKLGSDQGDGGHI